MALNRDRTFKAADKYIRSGNVKKAIEELEKWVSANRKDWNTIRQIGDLYARIGNNAEAIKKYSQIAEYYRQDGFNVRAIATYKMILRLDPQNEKAMRSLAELQVVQGLLMEAKAQYQALVELYNKGGHKRQAMEVFKKLTEIDPSDLKVRYKYAEFLEREGRVDDAVAEYVGIADQFINQGLVAEAIQFMEKGLKIDNTSRLLRTKLAQAAIMQGHHDKAIQLLEEVKEQYPRDAEFLSRLGEAYQGAGRGDAAEAVFRRLAELEPDNPTHSNRLAELAIGQGRLDEALEILGPAVDRWVEAKEGDRAVASLQKILAKDAHHVRTLLKLVEVHTLLKQEGGRVSAYDQLCEAYAKHGDYEKAVQVAEKLIEIEPENSQHKDRMKFLKSKLGGAGAAPAPPISAPELEPVVETGGAPSFEEPAIDLDAAVSDSLEPELAPVDAPSPTAPRQEEDEIAAVTSLSAEDEEHIKEKTTEAEVFVRYGLVDKAVEQLKDVLGRFRFHTGAREKLIEIYRDQGMNSEATAELVELSRIYSRLGDTDKASQAHAEAKQIDPGLAESSAESLVPDEVELTPETVDPYSEVGIADAGDETELKETESVTTSDGDPDIPISVDEADLDSSAPSFDTGEPLNVGVSNEEPEVEMDMEGELGVAPEPDDVSEDVDVVIDVEQPASAPSDAPVGESESPGVEIDLDGVGTAMEEEAGADEEVQVYFDEDAGGDIEDDLTRPPGTPSEASETPAPQPGVGHQEAASSPPTAGARDELSEVDEYMALGLYEDARHTLRELLKSRAGDKQVLAKIEEVGFSVEQLQRELTGDVPAPEVPPPPPPAVSSPPPAEQPPPTEESLSDDEPLAGLDGIGGPVESVLATPESDFVDLASELSEEVFGTQSAAADESSLMSEPPEALTDPGLDEMFREFKKGVEKQLGTEDYDTRYNLGIAYKEMGLLDEAIAEFQLASKDENRLLECCSMLGLCFMEKGMPAIAIKWFEKGLKAPGRSEEEQQGLRYDLAGAHEAAGDSEQALELYLEIFRENARFRDVSDKVRDLQAAQKSGAR